MIQRIKNYYTIEKKSPNNKSNWPLLNNKGVQQENVYIQNIKTEKMEWIEWLKMLKN